MSSLGDARLRLLRDLILSATTPRRLERRLVSLVQRAPQLLHLHLVLLPHQRLGVLDGGGDRALLRVAGGARALPLLEGGLGARLDEFELALRRRVGRRERLLDVAASSRCVSTTARSRATSASSSARRRRSSASSWSAASPPAAVRAARRSSSASFSEAASRAARRHAGGVGGAAARLAGDSDHGRGAAARDAPGCERGAGGDTRPRPRALPPLRQRVARTAARRERVGARPLPFTCGSACWPRIVVTLEPG